MISWACDRLLVWAGVAALLLFSTSCFAQAEEYRLSKPSEADAVAVGNCLIAQNPADINALLQIAPQSEGAARRWSRIASSACSFGERIRPNVARLRGGLFIILYRQRTASVASNVGLLKDVDLRGDPEASEHRRRMAIVGCAVRHEPLASDTLVKAPVGANRDMAFRVILVALSNCLVGEDIERFDHGVLVGYVAEVLYLMSSTSALPTIHADGIKS